MTVELKNSQLTIHTNAPINKPPCAKRTKLTAAYGNSLKNAGQKLPSKKPLAIIFEESAGISKEEAAVGTIAKDTGLVPKTTPPNKATAAPQNEVTIAIDNVTFLHLRTLFCALSQNSSLIEKIRSLKSQQPDKAELHLSESEMTDILHCLQNMVDCQPPLSALKKTLEDHMLAKILSEANEPVARAQQTPNNQDKQIRDYALRFANKNSTLHQIDWNSEKPLHLTTEENAEFLFCLKTVLDINPAYEDMLRPLIRDREPKNLYCNPRKLFFSEGSFIANESPAELAKITWALGFLDLSNTDTSDEDIIALKNKHTHIKGLDLSHCNNITNDGLSRLLMAPNLKWVDLSGCAKITLEHIQFLRRNFPTIELYRS